MGELSKKIGEHGESVVRNFLDVIGWSGAQEGESLVCHMPTKHQRKEGANRKTHGIDLFFSSRSNLQDFTLDNVVISVKYTSKPYPNSPNSTFKEHLKDLAQTVECFMKSELRSENNEMYEMSGINSASDVGVLFWLTNDRDSAQDIVSKVSLVQLDKDLSFDVLHVVDNAKAAFIYNSIKYVKNTYRDKIVYFHYAFGSSNYLDPNVNKYGSVLPVEYLTSNIIPLALLPKSMEPFYSRVI